MTAEEILEDYKTAYPDSYNNDYNIIQAIKEGLEGSKKANDNQKYNDLLDSYNRLDRWWWKLKMENHSLKMEYDPEYAKQHRFLAESNAKFFHRHPHRKVYYEL
ncbi:hypothetical protein LCGC14_0342580 [marine sediment metagenome]|uniref:Uncharacterized protein n=1 Tax=marine sediment metagenome TaxID=412755 RepID=A0A0F9TD91_9ZZZZ